MRTTEVTIGRDATGRDGTGRDGTFVVARGRRARDGWERILRAVRHGTAIDDAGVDGVVLGMWEGALAR